MEASLPVIHGSFRIERELAVPVAAVFAAYSDSESRRRWFRMPGPRESLRHELDFRVGGGETASNRFAPMGVVESLEYASRFLDICVDSRIVWAYWFALDGRRRWASLVTVELEPLSAGTRLTHSEQYALLEYSGDGSQDALHLEGGTRLQLNGLGAALGLVQ